jgi:hypothetical protein
VSAVRPVSAALLLALIFVGGAAAATFTFTVTTTTPMTLSTVTLNGIDQTKTFPIAATLAYTGGNNNAGWNVQVSATVPTAGSNTLPALKVTGAGAVCQGTCVAPTASASFPVTYPITLSTTAVRVINAAPSSGTGTFTITTTFLVTYPSNIFPGTYATTVSLSGATGP